MSTFHAQQWYQSRSDLVVECERIGRNLQQLQDTWGKRWSSGKINSGIRGEEIGKEMSEIQEEGERHSEQWQRLERRFRDLEGKLTSIEETLINLPKLVADAFLRKAYQGDEAVDEGVQETKVTEKPSQELETVGLNVILAKEKTETDKEELCTVENIDVKSEGCRERIQGEDRGCFRAALLINGHREWRPPWGRTTATEREHQQTEETGDIVVVSEDESQQRLEWRPPWVETTQKLNNGRSGQSRKTENANLLADPPREWRPLWRSPLHRRVPADFAGEHAVGSRQYQMPLLDREILSSLDKQFLRMISEMGACRFGVPHVSLSHVHQRSAKGPPLRSRSQFLARWKMGRGRQRKYKVWDGLEKKKRESGLDYNNWAVCCRLFIMGVEAYAALIFFRFTEPDRLENARRKETRVGHERETDYRELSWRDSAKNHSEDRSPGNLLSFTDFSSREAKLALPSSVRRDWRLQRGEKSMSPRPTCWKERFLLSVCAPDNVAAEFCFLGRIQRCSKLIACQAQYI